MARKHGMLRTVFTLGGLAAVGAVLYRNREMIRDFISEATGTYTPEETAAADETKTIIFHPMEKSDGEEPVIVIDRSAEPPEDE